MSDDKGREAEATNLEWESERSLVRHEHQAEGVAGLEGSPVSCFFLLVFFCSVEVSFFDL